MNPDFGTKRQPLSASALREIVACPWRVVTILAEPELALPLPVRAETAVAANELHAVDIDLNAVFKVPKPIRQKPRLKIRRKKRP